MSENFLFELLVTLFASLIVYRMLNRARVLALIEPALKNKIFFLLMVCLLGFARWLPFQIFFFLCPVLFFFPLVMMWVVSLIRRAHFEKAVIEVLDLSVLRMKSGMSFRQALGESVRGLTPHLRFYFMELMSHLEVEKTASTEKLRRSERDFLKIILSVNHTLTRQIEKLASFRANEKMKNYFRLKSRQMTAQVRVQAVVLIVFYVFLAIFQISRHPQITLQFYFWLSMGLGLVGTFLLYLLPRGFRWKV